MIKGLQKTSLIDYPGNICSILFLSKCNFRCHYCYNPELVLDLDLPVISEEGVLKVLDERKGFIDGVCITGGEPTMHKELPEFVRKIKEKNLQVKLDTNGANPEMLKQLIDERLIDFIAMDIKNVFEKYEETTCSKVNIEMIKKSIDIITNSGIDHEFRTTILPRFHKKEDIMNIVKSLKSAKKYVLQQFVPSEKMLNESFKKEKVYSKEELEEIRKECKKYVDTEIRNI